MELRLRRIEQRVGPQVHLYPLDLTLVPLAVTSTRGWMRRLGSRWHRLHRLIYPAAILGCTHAWWQVKADWREPALYATVLAFLLAWRIRRVRRRAA